MAIEAQSVHLYFPDSQESHVPVAETVPAIPGYFNTKESTSPIDFGSSLPGMNTAEFPQTMSIEMPDNVKPPQKCPPSKTKWTVEEGDTLGGIAFDCGINIDELAELNKMNIDDILSIGRRLKLPKTRDAESAPNPAVNSNEMVPEIPQNDGGGSMIHEDNTTQTVCVKRVELSEEKRTFIDKLFGVNEMECTKWDTVTTKQPLESPIPQENCGFIAKLFGTCK